VTSGVSKGELADLLINWEYQVLQSLNDGAFANLFNAVTNNVEVDLKLRGVAEVTARTPIGDIDISEIAFDVTSQLHGA
jgi:hypothetical protein